MDIIGEIRNIDKLLTDDPPSGTNINIALFKVLNILTELYNKLDSVDIVLANHISNSYSHINVEDSREEFKPCPFCGGEHVWADVNTTNGNKYACGKCGASPGYRPTPSHAKTAWNNRSL